MPRFITLHAVTTDGDVREIRLPTSRIAAIEVVDQSSKHRNKMLRAAQELARDDAEQTTRFENIKEIQCKLLVDTGEESNFAVQESAEQILDMIDRVYRDTRDR